MADELKMNLSGFSELIDLFEQLPEDIAKKSALASLRKAAKVTLEEAKKLVPVRTGLLRGSLKIKFAKVRGFDAKVSIGAQRPFYRLVHLIEFGTKPHIIAGPIALGGKSFTDVQHPGTTKQPFMRPALLNTENEVLKKVFSEILGDITKAFKKLKK